jgi:hypothetical protein
VNRPPLVAPGFAEWHYAWCVPPVEESGSKRRYTMQQPNGVKFATTFLRTDVTLHYA